MCTCHVMCVCTCICTCVYYVTYTWVSLVHSVQVQSLVATRNLNQLVLYLVYSISWAWLQAAYTGDFWLFFVVKIMHKSGLKYVSQVAWLYMHKVHMHMNMHTTCIHTCTQNTHAHKTHIHTQNTTHAHTHTSVVKLTISKTKTPFSKPYIHLVIKL